MRAPRQTRQGPRPMYALWPSVASLIFVYRELTGRVILSHCHCHVCDVGDQLFLRLNRGFRDPGSCGWLLFPAAVSHRRLHDWVWLPLHGWRPAADIDHGHASQ